MLFQRPVSMNTPTFVGWKSKLLTKSKLDEIATGGFGLGVVELKDIKQNKIYKEEGKITCN